MSRANTAVLFCPGGVIPFGTRIGSFSNTAGSITNPFAASGSVSVEVGDLVVAAIGERGNLTTTAMNDNLGNTYSAQNAGTDGGNQTGRCFYSRVTNAGIITSISATTTASNDDVALVAAVYKGPFATSPLDANPANVTDTSTPYTCPATGTLAQSDELVVSWGGFANGKTDVAATSPMTLDVNAASGTGSNTVSMGIASKVVSSTTTTTPEFTTGASSSGVFGTLSFKKA